MKNLISLGKDISNSKLLCFYNGESRLKIDDVIILPWKEGLEEFGLVL